MDNKIQYSKSVPPFVKFCAANIPVVFDDSLSYYEALCALWKWMQDNLVDVINNNAAVTDYYIEYDKETRALFIQLKEYVDTYFDNLDVQDEINHKLDEMVEDGTLEALLADLITSKVEYIFPKFMEGSYSGDCTLIKYKDTNILIDSWAVGQWTDIKEMLDTNGATHLDYFILSHYHTDHDGNLANLINNGYIDSNTTIFMSAKVTTYPAYYLTEMQDDLDILDNNNLEYRVPNEGEVLTIEDDLKLTFYNCDRTILDAYSEKDPNSCSTVIFVEHGQTCTFLSADATADVYKRLYSVGLPKRNVDLYKLQHHGISRATNSNFVKELAPKYAVQTSGILDAVKGNFGLSGDARLLAKYNTPIYPCHMQEDYIRFIDDGSSIQCISGRNYGSSMQSVNLHLYVDINADKTNIQDGTQEHPFTEVMQAVASIPYQPATNIFIEIADGYYGKSHEAGKHEKNRITIDCIKDKKITINGNSSDRTAVTLNGLNINNSYVVLNDLAVDVDMWSGIYAYNTYLEADNVVVKSSTDVTSTENSGILLRQNSVMVVSGSGLRVEQCNTGLIVQTGSVFTPLATVELGVFNTQALSVDSSSIAYTQNYFTFDNAADQVAFTKYLNKVNTPLQIMDKHEEYATSITLLQDASNFNWIEIVLRTNDNNFGSTGKIYAPDGKTVSVVIPHRASSGVLYYKQCAISISGTTLKLSNLATLRFESNQAYTITVGGNIFQVDRVIGGYRDYVELRSS